MRYPSVNDYIESVRDIGSRVRTLGAVEPLRDPQGEPRYTVSKGRVTFLVRDGAGLAGITCFTSAACERREKSYLEQGLRKGEFRDMELFVFPEHGAAGDYFPVVVCDYEEHAADGREPEQVAAPESYVPEGRCPVEKDGLWGFSDCEGNIAVEPRYDRVGEFSEGRAVVEKDGMMGLIDRCGNEIVPAEYDDLSWDGGVLLYTDKGGRKGCLDRMGGEVVPCLYDWIGEFSSGLALVVRAGKHGYVDMEGNEALPFVYDSATSFDEHGFALVTVASRRMMIDRSGQVVR